MSSQRVISSEAVCPSFKSEGSFRVALLVRKERTNHLDQGNSLVPGALNFSVGDHRFLLPTRQRGGFGVLSHISHKLKALAIDEFGLCVLTNY